MQLKVLPDDAAGRLTDRLRQILIKQARAAAPVTYMELATYLGLMPPQTIHQLTFRLERLMAQDAAAGRPLLAALCVGRLGRNMPRPGFFITAEELGLYKGPSEGPEAHDFHQRELARLFAMYRQLPVETGPEESG